MVMRLRYVSFRVRKTQLNWPGGMSLDPDTGDLYVANDMGHSVIVFRGPTG
jgi:hypothetical protein